MANRDIVQRAQTDLQIAQLRFKQALKKEERTPTLPGVSQEQSNKFCDEICAVFRQNTPQNVQTCKDWIVKHISPSKARIALLGDYLVALSKSNVVERDNRPGKAIRNRLDILLVVSDVLHSAKFHAQTHSGIDTELRPYIEKLVELVASCLCDKGTSFEKKLKALIKYWRANELLPVNDVNAILATARKALRLAQGDVPPATEKIEPTLPEWFGDRNASWHDLPASYLLEGMIRDPARPIRRNTIRVKRFNKRQPSEQVRGLLEEYFNNIDLAYRPCGDNVAGESEQGRLWLDSVGNFAKQEKGTNEVKPVSNGYGWTAKMCEDMEQHGEPENIMKAREEYSSSRMDVDKPDMDRGDRRGYVADGSHSPKRRRYSSDSEHDRPSRHRDYDSRPSSRSSYDSRDDRPSSRDDRRERSRPSRFGDRDYDDKWHDRDHDGDFDQRRPPNPYSRGPTQPSPPTRWPGHSFSDQNKYNDPSVSNIYNPPPPPNGGFNQAHPPPPPPPPPPNPAVSVYPPQPPFPGQFPMPPFPPPFLGAPAGAMSGMSVPPPPPNLSAPFPNNFPQMGGYPNNGYNNFGNGPNTGGNHQGYGGFNRGGFYGGNYNDRGGFQGNNQRGRGGGGGGRSRH